MSSAPNVRYYKDYNFDDGAKLDAGAELVESMLLRDKKPSRIRTWLGLSK